MNYHLTRSPAVHKKGDSFIFLDKNIGWRLDYFITSKRIADNIRVSDMIDDEKKTSDHCPIILKITI